MPASCRVGLVWRDNATLPDHMAQQKRHWGFLALDGGRFGKTGVARNLSGWLSALGSVPRGAFSFAERACCTTGVRSAVGRLLRRSFEHKPALSAFEIEPRTGIERIRRLRPNGISLHVALRATRMVGQYRIILDHALRNLHRGPRAPN